MKPRKANCIITTKLLLGAGFPALTSATTILAKTALPSLENAKQPGLRLASAFLPALGNLNQRGAEIATPPRHPGRLAIEQYRIKHANAHPVSLSALAPEFLASVPTDPYASQPLRYKKLAGKGYVVYSICKNLVDDGGLAKGADGKAALDVTFTVTR